MLGSGDFSRVFLLDLKLSSFVVLRGERLYIKLSLLTILVHEDFFAASEKGS